MNEHIRYEPDERAPRSLTLIAAFQGAVLVVSNTITITTTFAVAFNDDGAYLEWAVFAALALAGVAVALQATRLGRLGPETETPAWRDADPREYTIEYVNNAVERYERDGLESFLQFYNSVASFEGEWYLFATDADDIYHVHPLLPNLIGVDIKDVVGSDGYRLGEALAEATEEGVWVEYLWPHPVTLKEVPKVGYAVRRDGMIFASGYYVRVDDPAGETVAYVEQAIEYYKTHGLAATITHYSGEEGVVGQWGLTLADENDILLVAHLTPQLLGRDLKVISRTGRDRNIGEELSAATEDGIWVSNIFPNARTSELLYSHTWAVRYDGLLFMSRYYDEQPDVPQ